ncbi:MAG: hypothetical protein SGBAC_003982 [Bacillariaceae sp.]
MLLLLQRGDMEIFDLGLAKEIPKNAKPGAVFAFTGMCGTPRYMAPEVLWLYEILEMAQPFVSFTAVGRFLNRFWSSKGAQFRPPISKLVHTKEVKSLLDKAWSTKHQERPSASEFEDIMRKECVAFNQDLGMNVSARRSTFIFVKGQGEKVNELKRRKLKSKGEGCFPT